MLGIKPNTQIIDKTFKGVIYLLLNSLFINQLLTEVQIHLFMLNNN